MQIPQQPYRWLVFLKILQNEGQPGDKNMVQIPQAAVVNFQSGYSIAEIVKNMLRRAGAVVPGFLDNVRKDGGKNVKATNWNFVWLAFDQLRMQFDGRIKDLILQGQNALIVQIIKQLYDRDDHKNPTQLSLIPLPYPPKPNPTNPKKSPNSNPKSPTTTSTSLDIKKLNLQKNPEQSESSLQFLILLLSTSLNMSVEEILGLFTNQNKYLAHIIVKGVNQEFGGVLVFYGLLGKYCGKLRMFIEQDQRDAESCLYAIKPGFISKNQQVAQLTIDIFSKLGNIYPWLTNPSSHGSTTILLGIKRHPNLVDSYWNLLFTLIQNNQTQFFLTHFKPSFKDSRQMIEICLLLLRPIGESFVREGLREVGVFGEWVEIGVGLVQAAEANMGVSGGGTGGTGAVEDMLLGFQFLGEMMLWLPEAMSENEGSLQVFTNGWKQRKLPQYILLLNQILQSLQTLAQNRNQYASKLYQILIQIFQQILEIPQKKQYLIQNFTPLIQAYPKMPSQYFIQCYANGNTNNNGNGSGSGGFVFDPADYWLVRVAVMGADDMEGLGRIGGVLLRGFNWNAVVNGYLGPLIFTIVKKTIHDEIGQAFATKAVKDCLHSYSILQTTKKNPKIAQPQPMYFNYKGNSQKLSQSQIDAFKTKQKESSNIIQLVQKICDFVKNQGYDSVAMGLKEIVMETNAYIRKNHNKVVGKGIAGLLRKFGVSKEEELGFDQEYRNKRLISNMEESLARKRSLQNNLSVMAASRIGTGPQHLKKQFTEMIQKRRKQQQQKKLQQQRRAKQQLTKLAQAKKQLQRQQLLRGFGSGQAQLKQQGFWNKILKQDPNTKQLQLYPPALMEVRDTDYIENLFRRYHRIVRFLFVKYSNSMYSIKSLNNFQDNQARKETLNLVEAIKFLKEYKLFFLTNNNQVHNLIRDINVKLLNKRETQQLDFIGFQHFLVQFSAIIFTKTHSINTKTSKSPNSQPQTTKKSLLHLSHSQLLQQLFNYIKLVFQQKGQKTTMFDQPQAAYFNQSQVIKEFNKKIQEDPGFILPEGYKKVTEKVIGFFGEVSKNVGKNLGTYLTMVELLDQIIFQSSLNLHILEPITKVTTKTRVKPQAFTNIKPKLMTDTIGQSKIRATSSAIDRKIPALPPPKMMQRKVLSFGMKLGLSYVSYKDKLLGEQVAYLIDDMITAIENGKNTVQKNKIVNEVVRKRLEYQSLERQAETEKEKKRKERKEELEKIKKETAEKKQKELQETKQERQKKKQKQLQKQKKKKQQVQKYLAQQKSKLKQKKQKEQEEKAKQQQQKKKKKQQQLKAKQKFKQFNQKQIQKLKKTFEETSQQKKKQQEKAEEEKKNKDQLFKKLRNKISSQDKKIIQIRQKNNQEISELFGSEEFGEVFKKFQPNLKGLYDFLIRSTHLSLTQRKHNNEIILQTWTYFNIAFQLNPYIISSKNVITIFKSLTKDKQISKQYYLGLNYEQFQQALLRIAIKHKTIFNKIAEKIKENDMSEKEIDAVIDKDIEEKEKNQFDQPKEIDVKGLLVQEDINKEVFDDYGEIKKVTPTTLKGLIYYLKVPKDKAGQQKRFRQVISQKSPYIQKYQKLKQKLKQEYTLQSPTKKKNTEAQVIKSQENASPEKNVEKEVEKSKTKK